MARRVSLTISLPPLLSKRLTASARDAEMSKSAFIVAALQAYLDQVETELKLFANESVRTAWLKAMQQPGVLKSMAAAMGAELSDRDRQKLLKFMESAPKGVE